MMRKYSTLDQLLDRIEEPNRSQCYTFLDKNREILQAARGGKSKHQAWDGGYLDHISEVMNIAVVLYDAFQRTGRPLPFELSDALLVLFLHDVDKPWRYVQEGDLIREREEMNTKEKRDAFTEQKVQEYGFQLTDAHHNALSYVEGEVKDYNPDKRLQQPLAAFCHLCDTTSARIWFDYPLAEDDPWRGARRGRF